MNIYDYQTFEIGDFAEAKLLLNNLKRKRINVIHNYQSVIWQGPRYVKLISEKLKKKKY